MNLNLGDLTKPATVLVERISDAVGWIFKPRQIRRVAKAEADAELIRVKSEIEANDLRTRALRRLAQEEEKRQTNMEDIAQKALPLVGEDAAPQDVEDDWITNFFDKGRTVSDEDMQLLWARILAGQANTPGAYSMQTVNLLANLDKRDAGLFTRLCAFTWIVAGTPLPLVLDVNSEIYARHGVNFLSLSHLDSLGLIRLSNLVEFQRRGLPKRTIASYYGRSVEITLPRDANNNLVLGRVLFTRPGEELARICQPEPIAGFYEYACGRWKEKGLGLEEAPRQGTADGPDRPN